MTKYKVRYSKMDLAHHLWWDEEQITAVKGE